MGFSKHEFTTDIVFKGVVIIAVCECDAYPTAYGRMIAGYVIKHHGTFVMMMTMISSGPRSEVETTSH